MILLVSVLGKVVCMKILTNRNSRQIIFKYSTGLIFTYFLFSIIISLQIYVTVRLLIPWLLPSVTLWNYIRLEFKEKYYPKTYAQTQ